MRALPPVFLLLRVLGLASFAAASAHTLPSECEALRLENQRLAELLGRLSARCPEPDDPRSIGWLGERRRAKGAARALLLLRTEDAAVVQGETNTNECPVGSAAISSEQECQQAAEILGIEFSDTAVALESPKACYPWAGVAKFNTHPVGSADPDSSPICYAKTSAPTPGPTRIGDTISPMAASTWKGATRDYTAGCVSSTTRV